MLTNKVSKLPYPSLKLVVTANHEAIDDAKQFVNIRIPGVPSLERGIFVSPLRCYGIVPKSNGEF